jgi:hypothetical protein
VTVEQRVRLLKALLRLGGVVTVSGFAAILLPEHWMASSHEWVSARANCRLPRTLDRGALRLPRRSVADRRPRSAGAALDRVVRRVRERRVRRDHAWHRSVCWNAAVVDARRRTANRRAGRRDRLAELLDSGPLQSIRTANAGRIATVVRRFRPPGRGLAPRRWIRSADRTNVPH